MLEGLLRSTLRVYWTTLEEPRATPQIFLNAVWNSWLVPELNIGNSILCLVGDDVSFDFILTNCTIPTATSIRGFTLEEGQQLSKHIAYI